jgi:tetratricopeptide (TPR) repeat protein
MNGILPLRAVASVVRAEAHQALDLNPTEVGPRLLLGGIAAAYDYDWKAAAEHFQVALAANPVAPNARWAYSSFYTNPFGRFEESAANMQLEVEHDPLNVLWRSILANNLHHAGMHARAVVELRKALELDANFWLAHYNLAEIYLTTGKLEDAVAAGERAYQLAPWNSMATGMLAAALFRGGERERAQALIEQMGERPIPVWGRVA